MQKHFIISLPVENLTDEQAGVLLSVDLESLDVLGLEQQKETYLNSLIEMGNSTEEAEEIWKGFIDTVATYGSNLYFFCCWCRRIYNKKLVKLEQ